MSPSLRAYYVTAQCLAQDSPVHCIRPTEHATKAEHPPCREGTGVQRRGVLTARSTNGEPPSLEWGPGRGRGLAGKVAVFNRYGGSFVRYPALAEEENQSGWADIPSPWTEPRALFPSGAQSSLWLCSKTLASAQGAGCSHSRLDLRPLPPPPPPRFPILPCVSQRPWKTSQVGAELPPAVFLSTQHRTHWVPGWRKHSHPAL